VLLIIAHGCTDRSWRRGASNRAGNYPKAPDEGRAGPRWMSLVGGEKQHTLSSNKSSLQASAERRVGVFSIYTASPDTRFGNAAWLCVFGGHARARSVSDRRRSPGWNPVQHARANSTSQQKSSTPSSPGANATPRHATPRHAKPHHHATPHHTAAPTSSNKSATQVKSLADNWSRARCHAWRGSEALKLGSLGSPLPAAAALLNTSVALRIVLVRVLSR
jgi:hypothetical protein